LRRTWKCASLLSFCAPCIVGASGRSPEKMGVRPDAPTIETIVPVIFYESIREGRPGFRGPSFSLK